MAVVDPLEQHPYGIPRLRPQHDPDRLLQSGQRGRLEKQGIKLRDPDSIGIATRVLAIPVKREDKKLDYLLKQAATAAAAKAPGVEGQAYVATRCFSPASTSP